MKKKICLLALGLCLLTSSTAHAALIGIKDILLYPHIFFGAPGQATYNSTGNIFQINALDRFITFADKKQYPLWYNIYIPGTPPTTLKLTTTFFLRIEVDGSGKLSHQGIMEEIVTEGTAKIFYNNEWHSFSEGTTLLKGDVYAFGWGEGPLLGQFDFLVGNLSGALVNSNIWPTNVPTGIWALAENLKGWTGSWENDFSLDRIKGEKAPVPVPTSVILLGTGLLGLIGIGRILRNR